MIDDGFMPIPDYGGKYSVHANGTVYNNETRRNMLYQISPFGKAVVVLDGDAWPVNRLVWSVHGSPISYGLDLIPFDPNKP